MSHDLKDLVESLDKIKAIETPLSFQQKMAAYIDGELQNLKNKQADIQRDIETKNKEATLLRETLLVVNGALQGVEHIQRYLTRAEEAPSLNSSSNLNDPNQKEPASSPPHA